MSIDPSNYKGITVFTLSDAAMAWAEVAEDSDEPTHLVNVKLNELIAACKRGDLPYKSVTRGGSIIGDHFGGSKVIPGVPDWQKCEVKTKDLIAFFKKRGEKPLFLFHESQDDAEKLNAKELQKENTELKKRITELKTKKWRKAYEYSSEGLDEFYKLIEENYFDNNGNPLIGKNLPRQKSLVSLSSKVITGRTLTEADKIITGKSRRKTTKKH